MDGTLLVPFAGTVAITDRSCPMRIKAIFFDLDGTLVDSNDLHVQAWQRTFAETNRDVPPHSIRQQIGKGADKLVRALIPDLSNQTVDRLGERHGEIFKDKFLKKVRPFRHARQLLAHVQASGRDVVVASSASKNEVGHYLTLLGAEDIVRFTTSVDDVAESKPAPDIFQMALGRLGIPATAAMVVGDSPFDVAAAEARGLRTIGVRSGGFSDQDLAGAIATYDNVAELLAAFDESPIVSER